jgi:hypothetical protein
MIQLCLPQFDLIVSPDTKGDLPSRHVASVTPNVSSMDLSAEPRRIASAMTPCLAITSRPA